MRALGDTPPLYLATLAIIAGDTAGNAHFYFPLWWGVMLALGAGGAYLAMRPGLGAALAFAALAATATIPVYQQLEGGPLHAELGGLSDGSQVTIEGYLEHAPQRVERLRELLEFDVRVNAAGPTGERLRPARGLVRTTSAGDLALQVGDVVRVIGSLRYPRNDGNPGEFDYRSWLLRQGITASIYAMPSKRLEAPVQRIGHRRVPLAGAIERIRSRIGQFIDESLSYPANVEMRALLIGDRGGINDDLRQRFALTGMAHLLVISGLHLGFVAAAAYFLGRWLMLLAFPALAARGYASKVAALCGALAVTAYAAIAGHHISTFRAWVMVLSYALAILLDRSRELVSSLALAALVILLAMPGSTADIGFQLSFASVLVIILGMRRFAAWWRWRYQNPLAPRSEASRLGRGAEMAAGYVAVSFWAMVGTAPLTAFHFNQFSMVGLIANAVVVPLMGFGSVVLGLAAAALSFIAMPPARVLIRIAGQLAVWGTGLAGWFARWPLAWARVFTPTPLELAIVYCLILLWLTAPLAGASILDRLRRAPGRRNQDGLSIYARMRHGGALLLLAALSVDTIWWGQHRFFNQELRVTFLSVGEGDAAVVRFPGSRVMLIDGGGAFRSTFDPGERIVAPYLWSQKIMRVDYVALSHPDRDHFGGLTFIARNFSPSEFWTSGVGSKDDSYEELIGAMHAAGARFRVCDSSAAALRIGAVTLTCVGPLSGVSERKENNSSMVLRVTYGRDALLFAGDIEAKGERELIASGAKLDAQLLKVPHHGSRSSSSAAFIAVVHPQVAVISLGYHNRFHFPAEEVIERYRDAGAEILRTDDDGAIMVDADGQHLAVSSYRHRGF